MAKIDPYIPRPARVRVVYEDTEVVALKLENSQARTLARLLNRAKAHYSDADLVDAWIGSLAAEVAEKEAP